MTRIQIIAGLLALSMAAGCKAQTAPTALDAATTRRVEVMVRQRFDLPQDYSISIGQRAPGTIAGYDALPITILHNSKSQVLDFMLSKDGKTLARLDKFELMTDPAFSIDVAGRPVRGNPHAKVTVINFDDLECPYCARLHQTLFPNTIARYKDTVNFIYKDNPLPPDMHPWALHAAVDANCLAAQNGDVYWKYVDYLHAHGQEVSGPDRNLPHSYQALDRIARQVAVLGKLDGPRLDACIAKQDDSEVKASLKEAEGLKVESAPAMFIDGERVDGAVPEEQIWMAIDRALRAAGETPPPMPLPAAPVPPASPTGSAGPAGQTAPAGSSAAPGAGGR